MEKPHSKNAKASVYHPSQLGPILFISLIFFLTFIARVLISPLMPKIEAELGLRHAQAGALFLWLSVGYFIALATSGIISARIGHRRTIVLAACGVGGALIAIALSDGLWQLRGAVFLLGIAAGIYLPSGITTLTDMVNPGQWGKAIALHEMAPNLGFVCAPLIAEMLLIYFPWRGVPAAVGVFAFVIGLLFALFGKGGNFLGKPPGMAAFRVLFSTREFWIMVLLFGLAISSTMGIYTMLPLFLTNEIGIARNTANTLIGISRLFGIGSALISGWAADRFGPRRTIRFMLGATGLATILLGAASSAWFAVGCVFVQAVLGTCYFPAGFSVLSAIAPPEYRNVTVSLTIPFAFVFGGGITPALIGASGDFGNFGTGIMIIGALIATGALLPTFLRPNED
ncbi:MAG: MFS transporter [Thermodesulfobacteriota bacterium]